MESGSEEPRAKSSVYAWYFVLIVTGTNVINFLHTYLLSAVAVAMQRDVGFNGGWQYAVLVGPIFTLAKTLSAAPIGKLLEISQRVHLLAYCMLTWSAATTLMGFVTSYNQLLVLRIMQGAAMSGCVPVGQSLLFDVTPAGYLGTAMAIFNTGVYLGFGIAIGAGSRYGQLYGWRNAFVLSGLLATPLAFVLFTTLREPARGARETGHAPKRIVHDTSTEDFFQHWINSPGLLLLCIGCSVRMAGGNIWGYNMVSYYKSQGVSTEVIAAWMSWLPMFSGVLGSLLGGYFGDKSQKWQPQGGRLILLVGCCISSAPLMAAALLLPAPWSFLFLIAGYSVAEMWMGVAMTVMVGMVPDNMRTASVAFYLFIVDNVGSLGLLLVRPVESYAGTRWGLLFSTIQPLVAQQVETTIQKSIAVLSQLDTVTTEDTHIKEARQQPDYGSDGNFSEEGGGEEKDRRCGKGRRTRTTSAPTVVMRSRFRRGGSFVDVLDLIPADICWKHGHQCMICGCTRPKRF